MTNANETKDAKFKWTKKDWLLLGTNVLVFAILYFIFNNRLPDEVAAHYNINGEADRMMSRTSFWLMYAGIGIVLPTLLSVMRYIDPRQSNYARFEGYYDLMRWAISLFLHGIMLFVILDNAGYDVHLPNLITGGLGVLWIIIGNRMGQVRSNFFIGIRTPWALLDENNWRLTHRLGARLWVIGGLIMFICAWFVSSVWTVGILLACALASSLIPFAYSYMLFKKKTSS
ncbi:SdpI family protein [Cohnella herbarum]|uniref:DUF1648 domain-containing protein n=1 Tax=Cohnella herbarum TaxID=2728023 RepID=A0A7Z2VLC4_9BACL|nr:SdpI family protein [Cohnella herbarum]QJD85164.1 DUF1648 domain-containing protein [Cohnella herbarum]